MKKRKQRNTLLDAMAEEMPTPLGSSNSRTVFNHEQKAAAVIGGKRHSGSGAKMGLKSDCSSDRYQLEAKQTQDHSITLSMAWLEKITKEAMGKSKCPMMHIRFLNPVLGVDRDWVVIPDKEFKRLLDGFSGDT
jgi:hypothetical protein